MCFSYVLMLFFKSDISLRESGDVIEEFTTTKNNIFLPLCVVSSHFLSILLFCVANSRISQHCIYLVSFSTCAIFWLLLLNAVNRLLLSSVLGGYFRGIDVETPVHRPRNFTL